MAKRIYVHFSGGLGNQLFTFASSVAISLKRSQKVIILDTWYTGVQRGLSYEKHRRTFNLFEFEPIRETFSQANWFEKRIITLLEKIHFGKGINLQQFGIQIVDADKTDINTSQKNPKILYGYMQDPTNFSEIRESILNYIKLPKNQQTDVQNEIAKFRLGKKRLIAVHVRRGDYAHPNSFGCLLTSEYFRNALTRFDLKDAAVLVFSDTPEWCESDSFLNQFHIIKEESATKSLIMMSLCDDFVVSASTFSWWAAWLSESDKKGVIVPNPYNEFDDSVWGQLVMPGWIREKSIFETPSIGK
jgi:hypothetical protein